MQSYKDSTHSLSGIYNYLYALKIMPFLKHFFMKLTWFLIAIFLTVMISSCKHVVKYDCTGTTPTYTANVKPILDNTCSGNECHVGGHAASGIDLSTYAGASSASKKKSFMGSIQHKPFYQNMPKNAPILPDAEIHVLSCWVENGSPE